MDPNSALSRHDGSVTREHRARIGGQVDQDALMQEASAMLAPALGLEYGCNDAGFDGRSARQKATSA
jgi:hypothetical protein